MTSERQQPEEATPDAAQAPVERIEPVAETPPMPGGPASGERHSGPRREEAGMRS